MTHKLSLKIYTHFLRVAAHHIARKMCATKCLQTQNMKWEKMLESFEWGRGCCSHAFLSIWNRKKVTIIKMTFRPTNVQIICATSNPFVLIKCEKWCHKLTPLRLLAFLRCRYKLIGIMYLHQNRDAYN